MPLTHPLTIQLYCARNFPPVEAQLATIARHGFDNVETFGPFYEDPARTSRLLREHGLTAKSGHFALAMAEEQPARTRDIAVTLGIETIIVPYLMPDQRPTDRAGWAGLGARLETMAAAFAARGLRFAWHNHDFEFVALPDGSFPIEHLLGQSLLWEADIAWMVRADADPKLWIERYRGRIPLVHVKDIAPAGQKADEDGWADVGAGIMPWRDLWLQCVAAGAEIMVAEHDNPNDFDRFARVSAQAMRGFAKGGVQ